VDSLLRMLNVKGLDFSDIHRICQQNSIPKAGGSLDLVDSAVHAMSRLDTLFLVAKVSPFFSTDSSDSVRAYSDKLMANFSDPWMSLWVLVVWWWSLRAENFQLLPWCGVDLIGLLISGKKDSRSLICSLIAASLKWWNWILSLSRALLTHKVILEEWWLWYGAFRMRPLGTVSWVLHFMRKVRWLEAGS
jgi:hypothetical protein